MNIDRRDFLKMAGVGSVFFISGIGRLDQSAHAAGPDNGDFSFVQLSDTHWGFSGQSINPDFAGTLKKAVDSVNGLEHQPDFIMFTGDLTHTTDDGKERRRRLTEFRDIVNQLKVRNLKFMPGEHDAGLDRAEAYQELFGQTHYAFNFNGVHFIVLDNVSDPNSMIGETQLQWLSNDLNYLDKKSPIIVFTHRPLFDLAPDWDWHTRDGAKAVELLSPFSSVTVFYGHIHQEHHYKTGNIVHHAGKGLMFPLPAPNSVPKKQPIPWNAAEPYKGLGFRGADIIIKQKDPAIHEFGVRGESV